MSIPIKEIRIITALMLLLTASFSQTGQPKEGFFILSEKLQGSVEFMGVKYQVEKAYLPAAVLDSAATSFMPNGYPALLFFFQQNNNSFSLLNNTGKYFAWYHNDSLLTCARLLSFDSTYKMELAGNFTMQQVQQWRDYALASVGKKTMTESHEKEPVLESTKDIAAITTERLLQECEPMTKLFLQAIQLKNYQLMKAWVLDSAAKQSLLLKMQKHISVSWATNHINKTEQQPKKYFDWLVEKKNINWQQVKYHRITFASLQYFPQLDVYLADIRLNIDINGKQQFIKFDECFYFDNKWWLFCEDIRLLKD